MRLQVHRCALLVATHPVQRPLGVGTYTGQTPGRAVFFWVDFLGTISLLPDIFVLISPETAFSLGALNLARAGRAARLGGRVTLLIRALRR